MHYLNSYLVQRLPESAEKFHLLTRLTREGSKRLEQANLEQAEGRRTHSSRFVVWSENGCVMDDFWQSSN